MRPSVSDAPPHLEHTPRSGGGAIQRTEIGPADSHPLYTHRQQVPRQIIPVTLKRDFFYIIGNFQRYQGTGARVTHNRCLGTPTRPAASQISLAIQALGLKGSSARSSTSSSPVKLKRLHASMRAVELYVSPLLRQCKSPPSDPPHTLSSIVIAAAAIAFGVVVAPLVLAIARCRRASSAHSHTHSHFERQSPC